MRIAQPATFWIAVSAIALVMLVLLHQILLPFVVGALLAYLFVPAIDRLERFGINRSFAALAVFLPLVAGFIAFLRLRGDRASATPATSMPNFPANTLSDAQAKDIYAYIRTFKSNSPEVKDIPTLNAIVSAASRPYKP